MKKILKFLDLHVNRFGQKMSYNDLIKAVPREESYSEISLKRSGFIAFFMYFAMLVGTFSETYGSLKTIKENHLEAIFAWQVVCTLAILSTLVLNCKNPNQIWHNEFLQIVI